eukprot:TRINITY_DN33017_c0_g1_i1.p1 TRINITY_DN33017_c0_g1~~TRINITY_DN33017_c0_g1_i1.p1  ORF type:complete len:603 (-),score=100.87 TRINITY_DN33017_c0_g1_i1:120-1928(-)
MAFTEPNAIVLQRAWSSVWDATRYAREPPLHKPAFPRAACAAQLSLAAEAVVRLRNVINVDEEAEDTLPLEGRSVALLMAAVDGEGVLPQPDVSPAQFVKELVSSAFQTGDGEFGLGLPGKEKVESLFEEHCADLGELAQSLLTPDRAGQTLLSASAELSEAVQGLLASLARPGRFRGTEDAVALSGRLVQLSQEMHRLRKRVQDASSQAETPTNNASPKQASDAAPQSESDLVMEEDLPMDTTSDAPVDGEGDEEDEDSERPLKRTKSQCIRRLAVDEVAKSVEERREPVHQLRRLLSQLEKPKNADDDDNAAHRYEQAVGDLKQIDKLQQSFRNFGEDLMEGMLSLDRLSGLADQDRQARKETLKEIQALLDEVDNAKSRIAKVKKQLSQEVDRQKAALPEPSPATEPSSPQEQAATPFVPPSRQAERASLPVNSAKQERSRELTMPNVEWRQLRLPIKFSSIERPRAYFLSATMPGLDPSSIRISREHDNVLCIQGSRLPTARDQTALNKMLTNSVSQLPAQQRRQLTQEHVQQMMVELGHGRYGTFQEKFELPRDVDVENIDPSYEDGVLRLVLPRRPMSARSRPFPYGFDAPGNFMW